MVAAKESQTNQQISARISSYLDHMALLQHEGNYSLPCLPPAALASNAAFPGPYTSNFHGLTTGQQDTVGGVLKSNVTYCNMSHPTGSLYINNAQCALPQELDVSDKAINASCARQKRFLIFDQSGSRTRLFFSPSFSPQNQNLASKVHANANGLREEMVTETGQRFWLKPDLEENWDENGLTEEEEGEMREDTEEINALLYSNSDDGGDDDGENDEVTSTGHSPSFIEECYNENKLHEGFTGVANSDESPKRRRLLDGKYKKSLLENAKSPVSQPVSQCFEDDVESSCAGGTTPCYDKREKKIKIRQALMTLASIVPGLYMKDPLSIIDKAIVYLKSMKNEAEAKVEALQLSYSGGKSTPPLPNHMSDPVE